MSQMEYNLAKQTMENNKNNETQSRREFFKEAARKALPIIGAVVLLGNPMIAKAVENESLGCNGYCSQHCSAGCASSCDGCKNTCLHTCIGKCDDACARHCANYCNSSCSGSCKGHVR